MPRLLFVDDDAPTVAYVQALLTQAGHDVVALTSPRAALTRVESGERFDLAVLDVVMPDLSGDVLAARLRRVDPEIRVLFVTGSDEALFQARPVLWEGEFFLNKPFSPAGLAEAVSMALWGTTSDPHSSLNPKPLCSSRPGAAQPVSTAGSPSVLVVEDQPDAREMLAEYLRFCGFAVHGAEDGIEAVAIAVKERPRVILMDLMMPRMDGWEATRLIKADARTKGATVIAVSAHSHRDELRRAQQAGCDEFVPKPYDLERLANIVREHCRLLA